MSITSILKDYQESLSKEITKMERYISKAPEGLLLCYKEAGYHKWYLETVDASGTRKRKYLPKTQIELAKKLALKTYYSHKLVEEKAELNCINQFLKRSKPSKSNKFLQESSGYYSLLKDSLNLNHWENDVYDKSSDHPEALIIKTRKGDMVRSKSEAFIADSLYELGIEYRYECAFHVDDIVLYPDFTIIHPKTRQLFIWEHFGLMDSPSYVNKSLRKIPLFLSKSFMPGQNLIITYESQAMPLSFSHVKDMILLYFMS